MPSHGCFATWHPEISQGGAILFVAAEPFRFNKAPFCKWWHLCSTWFYIIGSYNLFGCNGNLGRWTSWQMNIVFDQIEVLDFLGRKPCQCQRTRQRDQRRRNKWNFRSVALSWRQEKRLENGLKCTWRIVTLGPGDFKMLINIAKMLNLLVTYQKIGYILGKMNPSMILYMHN